MSIHITHGEAKVGDILYVEMQVKGFRTAPDGSRCLVLDTEDLLDEDGELVVVEGEERLILVQAAEEEGGNHE